MSKNSKEQVEIKDRTSFSNSVINTKTYEVVISDDDGNISRGKGSSKEEALENARKNK